MSSSTEPRATRFKSQLKAHALIWWANGDGERLSARARERVEREIGLVERSEPRAGLLVSAISCWEVAMMVSRGRLALSLEVERWLALVAAIPAVRLLSLEPGVAVAAQHPGADHDVVLLHHSRQPRPQPFGLVG